MRSLVIEIEYYIPKALQTNAPAFPKKPPSLHLLGGREDLFEAISPLFGPNFPQKALKFPIRGGRGGPKSSGIGVLGGFSSFE